MGIRDFLKSYKFLCSEKKQIEDKISQIEYELQKNETAIFLYSPLSGKDIMKLKKQLDDLKDMYIQKINSICDKIKSIEDIIDGLDDPLERIVLRYRYIENMDWSDITERTEYEWAQLHRIHNRAISNLIAKEGEVYEQAI